VLPLVDIAVAAQNLVLEDVSKKIAEVFKIVRIVVDSAPHFKAPDVSVLTAPLAAAIQAVGAASELPRGRSKDPRGDVLPVMNALRAASEACASAAWILLPEGELDPMGRSPKVVVAEAAQSSEFYANKSLLEHRGKNDDVVRWTRSLMQFLSGFELFVARHCASGVPWRGVSPFSFQAATCIGQEATSGSDNAYHANSSTSSNEGGATSSRTIAATASIPPKPAIKGPSPPPSAPPPPPPPSLKELSAAGQKTSGGGGGNGGGGGGGGMSQLLSELNKGDAITTGLRKVTKDMKSKYANAASPSPSPPACRPMDTSSGTSLTVKSKTVAQGTPKFELEQGNRWKVEYQMGRKDLEITPRSAKEVIYLYHCCDCVLQIHGKVNAISVDSCSRVGIVFGDIISSFETVNSSSLQVQCTGIVPTLSLDKTDGCQVFISKKLSQTSTFQIVTAKCNSVNVTVLPDAMVEGDTDAFMDEDPIEQPIPEQFITTFDANGKLKTVAAIHSAA